MELEYKLDDIVSISNTSRTGIITLAGIDDGGEHYLVEIEDNDGNITTQWFRKGRLSKKQ